MTTIPDGRTKVGRGQASNLQDRYAPNSVCFGCGPKNPKGLHLKSVLSDDSLVAEWTPRREHVAFGSYGSGGIISVLLDCHGNWAAAQAIMKDRGLPAPPGTVTSQYTVRFLKPSPIDLSWELWARADKIEGDKASVSGRLQVGGETTATMNGVFVAVKAGHPAFDRWR